MYDEDTCIFPPQTPSLLFFTAAFHLRPFKLMINSHNYFRRALTIAGALWLAALIAEVTIFVVSPCELMGWGERAALRPDPVFGWRLIESKTTRLRWQGYDYVVTSNSLGFPGPEYADGQIPVRVSHHDSRGGFTSAEGVDTRSMPGPVSSS